MAWSAISLGYRADLHIYRLCSITAALRYEVVDTILRLCSASVGHAFVLMIDNARPCSAVLVEVYLESEEIVRMAWLGYSSDLTTIKNHWDTLGRAVCDVYHPQPVLKVSNCSRGGMEIT